MIFRKLKELSKKHRTFYEEMLQIGLKETSTVGIKLKLKISLILIFHINKYYSLIPHNDVCTPYFKFLNV